MRYIFLVFIFPIFVQAQNTIAFPDVVNFSKQSYSAGLQNWDIKQDKNGVMYFANNEGLVSYNGKYWKTYPLPNKTIVRSLEIGVDNKIYVGGQDELGYFSTLSNGELSYHSLTSFLSKKHTSFGDVWDIVSINNAIFFRTDFKILKYVNESFEVFSSNSQWMYLGTSNNKLYAQELNKGLLVFENNLWNLASSNFPLNDPITSIISFKNDSNIITTLKSGVFSFFSNTITPLANNINNLFFKTARIYACSKINENTLAFATTNNGVYVVDKNINFIQNFSKTEGLQNNNVLAVYLDNQSNLWLGLNNGIDLVTYNSAIKLINPYFQEAAGYTAIINNNTLYLGTANDLFSASLQDIEDLSFCKSNFTAVANTKGQSWGLAKINNQILLGHHDGAFIIENNIAKQFSNHQGFWNFTPTSSIFPAQQIIGGNYKGLFIFNYLNNQFKEQIKIPNFNESSRFVTIDADENIWVSHPYHGVYKINKQLNNEYKSIEYSTKNGLPSNLNNHVYKIKNEIVVATEKGIYKYNHLKNTFEPFTFYLNILGIQSIRYLKEDINGNVWFVHDKSVGVIDFSEKEPKIILIPELTNKLLSGFEFIYPINESNILLSGEKGFYHINYKKYKQTLVKPNVQIRLVQALGNNDSIFLGGYFKEINEPQIQNNKNISNIKYGWRTLHFEFSSSSYSYKNNLQYSYRLKGFDDRWSDWSEQTEKEYTNLPEGKYAFEVKVKNSLNIESDISSYTFNILPPWYISIWMKFLYLLLIALAIYLIYKWQQRKFIAQQKKHEEEQQKLQYIHDLELSKQEAELISLRNSNLENEIDFKNTELASSAMHLVQKGEILTKIKTSLTQIMRAYDNAQATSEIKKLLKSLGDDDNIDKEWEAFSKHFDKVHNNFLTALKEKHQDITPTELKLSAYLNMNLSTKEIAQLMNISVRGVEISRYRLRKKLQLPTEINLVDYMMTIETKGL